MSDPTYVVFNPHSGRGRGSQLVPPVLSALREGGAKVEHELTSKPGEETDIARAAIARGFRTIVAVGGDGTWSNTAQAVIASKEPVRLGLVPGGTGCDFARSLGVPQRDVLACVRIIREGRTRVLDVGRVEDRYFLNIVGFGYDVAVLEDSWNVAYLQGSALYLYCAMKQLGSYPGFRVALGADGDPGVARQLLMLIIANARVFGGGFRVAPEADLADGKLDAIAFGDVPFLRRVNLLGQLRRGTHVANPAVETTRSASFRLRFDTIPAYETDGEWNRARSAELLVETVPQALTVLVPQGS